MCAILASTIEVETINNKGKWPPGTTSKSDCLIPLIRLDLSTLGERCRRTIFTRWLAQPFLRLLAEY